MQSVTYLYNQFTSFWLNEHEGSLLISISPKKENRSTFHITQGTLTQAEIAAYPGFFRHIRARIKSDQKKPDNIVTVFQ